MPDRYYTGEIIPPDPVTHPENYDMGEVLRVAGVWMDSCRAEAHRVGTLFHLRKTRARRKAAEERQKAGSGEGPNGGWNIDGW